MPFFADRLKAARIVAGLSVKEVADHLEVFPTMIYAWENPKSDKKISVEKLIQLADLYQKSLDDLVGRTFPTQDKQDQ